MLGAAFLLLAAAAANGQRWGMNTDVGALLQVDPGQGVHLGQTVANSVSGQHAGLTFEALEVLPGSAVNIAIKGPNTTVNAFIDCDEGSVTYKEDTPSGIPLPVASLMSLHHDLAGKLQNNGVGRCGAQVMLMKVAGHLAKSSGHPDDKQIKKCKKKPNNGVGQCLKKGQKFKKACWHRKGLKKRRAEKKRRRRRRRRIRRRRRRVCIRYHGWRYR